MEKIILADGQDIKVKGNNMAELTAEIESYSELDALSKKINTENSTMVQAVSGGIVVKTFYDLTPVSPKFKIDECGGKITVKFGFRRQTESEMQREKIRVVTNILTDAQALMVKDWYPDWEKDPEGYQYKLSNPKDQRRGHRGKLWRLKKDHGKQKNRYPGADPTLWEEIVEDYAGNLEDPIPVPDSVTTSGFTYTYGKYYSEDGKVYLAKREGKEEGEKETLYYPPSALVGQYFVQVG